MEGADKYLSVLIEDCRKRPDAAVDDLNDNYKNMQPEKINPDKILKKVRFDYSAKMGEEWDDYQNYLIIEKVDVEE